MRAGMPGSGVPSDLMDLVQLTTAFMCSSSYLSAVRAPPVIARMACSSAQACWGPPVRAHRRARPDVQKNVFLTITGMGEGQKRRADRLAWQRRAAQDTILHRSKEA